MTLRLAKKIPMINDNSGDKSILSPFFFLIYRDKQWKNEIQYADMFLNEERHYPKFLGNIKTFNTEQYKRTLMKWVDNVYHQTMKRYDSVVSYYVDELKEEWNKHTSMIII